MEGLIFNIQKFSLHDGAGIRTDVFFQGCNLRCQWCSNPESQEIKPEKRDSGARYYTVDALMAELLKDKPFYDVSGGGVTLTGGEALLQLEFVCELCDALHASGVNVAIETAANIPPADFQRVLHKCDAIYIDLKHYDDEAHKRGVGVGNAQIMNNIRIALESGVRTVLRLPVIPGFNDSAEDMRRFAALLKKLGTREVQLLPFHQMGESKYQNSGREYAYAGVAQLHDEDVAAFAKALDEAGMQAQIGG